MIDLFEKKPKINCQQGIKHYYTLKLQHINNCHSLIISFVYVIFENIKLSKLQYVLYHSNIS